METNNPFRRSDAKTLWLIPASSVVGASGILRPRPPCPCWLTASVIAVGRDGGRLTALRTAAEHGSSSATLHVLACDAAQSMFPATLDESLQRRKLRLTSAILDGPATSPTIVAGLSAAVDGPAVELLVSDAAAPRDPSREWLVTDLPPLPDGQESRRRRLVLGWRHRNGVPARHNAEEVSAAAVAALALPPGDRVLAVVHPWRDRPE